MKKSSLQRGQSKDERTIGALIHEGCSLPGTPASVCLRVSLEISSMEEYLPSTCEALGSFSRATKTPVSPSHPSFSGLSGMSAGKRHSCWLNKQRAGAYQALVCLGLIFHAQLFFHSCASMELFLVLKSEKNTDIQTKSFISTDHLTFSFSLSVCMCICVHVHCIYHTQFTFRLLCISQQNTLCIIIVLTFAFVIFVYCFVSFEILPYFHISFQHYGPAKYTLML